MSRPRPLRLALLTLANILLPISVLVFASGFFPYKPFLPGLATFEDVAESGEELTSQDGTTGGQRLLAQPEPVFDKVVFMVVDALRSDFVFGRGSGFRFVQRYALPTHNTREHMSPQGQDEMLTTQQSHPRRRSHTLHRACHSTHGHHAPRQSSHHRLCALLPRSHSQFRGVGYLVLAVHAGYLARAAARGEGREAGVLWG